MVVSFISFRGFRALKLFELTVLKLKQQSYIIVIIYVNKVIFISKGGEMGRGGTGEIVPSKILIGERKCLNSHPQFF